MGLPEAAIEGLIAQLGQAGASAGAPSLSLLPTEQIERLVGNTIAVKTDVPDKIGEWRGALQQAQQKFAAQGVDWQIEVEFVDALLAVLDGTPPALTADHPYRQFVDHVQSSIEQFNRGA
jgi:hypothetical protein